MTDKDTLSFEDWLEFIHPIPEEDEHFYDAHGYELWHIREYKQDFEQARIVYRHQYNMYILASKIGNTPLEEYLRGEGRPLVRSLTSWTGFVFREVPEGAVGVSIFERDGDHFCLFPKFSLEQYMGMCTPGEHIEVLEDAFKSEEQMAEVNQKEVRSIRE